MSGGWDGSTRKSRLPPNWPALRRFVMERDGAICHICRGPGADRVDHVVQGDDHSPENLAPVHDEVYPHCHRFKSSQEGNDARRVKRQAAKYPRERHPGLR